jgi:hypothetical protein
LIVENSVYSFKKRGLILFIGIVFITGNSISQLSTWTGASFGKSLGKIFSLEVGYEYRLKNTREFDKSNVEGKFAQNWTRGIETFVKYRNSIENNKYSGLNSKIYAYNNRLSVGLDVSFLRLADVSKRTKLSWTITQQLDNYQFKRNSSVLRNKITFKQDIKNFFLSPFASAEHFYRWNRDVVYTNDEVIISSGTTAVRYFVGTEVEINKNQRFVIGFGFKDVFMTQNSNYILRLNYKFSF